VVAMAVLSRFVVGSKKAEPLGLSKVEAQRRNVHQRMAADIPSAGFYETRSSSIAVALRLPFASVDVSDCRQPARHCASYALARIQANYRARPCAAHCIVDVSLPTVKSVRRNTSDLVLRGCNLATSDYLSSVMFSTQLPKERGRLSRSKKQVGCDANGSSTMRPESKTLGKVPR
jgi:hypothetical protein